MDPIHPIVPRNPDVVGVAPIQLPSVGPQEREAKRREREEERERARRRAPVDLATDGDGEDDDDRPHVDLIA